MAAQSFAENAQFSEIALRKGGNTESRKTEYQ
jgi:hypothetical protein